MSCSFTLVLLSCTICAACGGDVGTDAPTFARDIAPPIYAACTPCHRLGCPTPFVLQSYDDAQRRRKQIVEVTQQRLMPPWLPAAQGLVEDRRLSEAQIELLRRWGEAGAPRGDPAVESPCPQFSSEWQLGAPDLVVVAERRQSAQPASPAGAGARGQRVERRNGGVRPAGRGAGFRSAARPR